MLWTPKVKGSLSFKSEIEKRGCATLVVDTGVLGEAVFEPDISWEQVASAGGSNLSQLIERKEHGEDLAVMTKGVAEIARELYEGKRIDGMISMGGGGASSAERLPTERAITAQTEAFKALNLAL